MPRAQPEQDLQRAVVRHLEARGATSLVYFHVPNGGLRSRVEAAIFKGLGVRAGVPDIILFASGQFYALELKAPGKKPTKAQLEFLQAFRLAGGKTAWADNLDDALSILELWRLLRGRAWLCTKDLPA